MHLNGCCVTGERWMTLVAHRQPEIQWLPHDYRLAEDVGYRIHSRSICKKRAVVTMEQQILEVLHRWLVHAIYP